MKILFVYQMNIYLNFSDIKNNSNNTIDLRDNIRYLYPKQNTVMNGEFTKLLLSKNTVTMNGLYLHLPISVEKKITANNEFIFVGCSSTSLPTVRIYRWDNITNIYTSHQNITDSSNYIFTLSISKDGAYLVPTSNNNNFRIYIKFDDIIGYVTYYWDISR